MTVFNVDPEALILVQRNWTIYHVKWADIQKLDDDDLVLIQRIDKLYHMRIGDYRDGKVSLGEYDFVWANLETQDRNEFAPSLKHFYFPWTLIRGMKFEVGADVENQSSSSTRIKLQLEGATSNWDGLGPFIIFPDGTRQEITASNSTFLIQGETYQQDYQVGTYQLVGSFNRISFSNSLNLININCNETLWNMHFWWSPGTEIDKHPDTYDQYGLGNSMFQNCQRFEGNLAGFDGCRVRNPSQMFQRCYSFNGDVSGLGLPTTAYRLDGMFQEAHAFNNEGKPLVLDTSLCEDMSHMFFNCPALNQDLSSLNTTNVTNMHSMFAFSNLMNSDIGGWDVSNVTIMVTMFRGCQSFNRNIGSWEVSNVTNMAQMFMQNPVFNNGESDEIKDWDVSNVKSWSDMFYDAVAFNQPLGDWVTTAEGVNYRSFGSMFFKAASFDQNLTGWCVDKVLQVPSKFADGSGIAGDLTKLPIWGTCP